MCKMLTVLPVLETHATLRSAVSEAGFHLSTEARGGLEPTHQHHFLDGWHLIVERVVRQRCTFSGLSAACAGRH